MSWKIPLFKIAWDNNDAASVVKVIKSGMYWAEGPAIKEFETALADYIGTRYCAVFSSGTSALHAALLAHGIGKGDEVIVPSFTFISTANAPLFTGAKPVFADIEKETLGLDPESVKRTITRRTKAIIAVHYGGMPCKITELRQLAKNKGLILIEDAAESFGAKIGKKNVGTFGNSAMLSFCQNKIISTGEGGAIVTNDSNCYKRLKLMRSHGRLEDKISYFSSTKPFDYVCLGYNLRMNSFTAALGLSQLQKADALICKRRRNAAYLSSELSKITRTISVLREPEKYFGVFQLFSILVDQDRDKLMAYLAGKSIMTKVYFSCIHLTHFYRNVLHYKCHLPVSEGLSKKIVSLPIFPDLNKKEMDIIVKHVRAFFRRQT